MSFFSNRLAKYENVSPLSKETIAKRATEVVKLYKEKVDELIKRDKGEPHQYDTKGRVKNRSHGINAAIEGLLT